MKKAKVTKKTKGPNSKHLQSRVSYLHKAASYLSIAQKAQAASTTHLLADPVVQSTGKLAQPSGNPNKTLAAGEARYLLSQLRSVALKSQIRLNPETKHSVCKRCNSLLVADETSRGSHENPSKGAAKPWAAISVIQCQFCGCEKRFPAGGREVRTKSYVEAPSLSVQKVKTGASN